VASPTKKEKGKKLEVGNGKSRKTPTNLAGKKGKASFLDCWRKKKHAPHFAEEGKNRPTHLNREKGGQKGMWYVSRQFSLGEKGESGMKEGKEDGPSSTRSEKQLPFQILFHNLKAGRSFFSHEKKE